MAKLKITKADLIGNIAGFPIEVVQKMLDEQFLQGNKVSLKVFQNKSNADRNHGGFNWDDTKDGREFWTKVINHKKFDKFFKRYPQRYNWVYIVGDSEIGIDIIKTLEQYGGINSHGFTGNCDDCLYYIDPVTNVIEMCNYGDSDMEEKENQIFNLLKATYTCIDAEEFYVEVTMDEIAKMLGVDVRKLKIKK